MKTKVYKLESRICPEHGPSWTDKEQYFVTKDLSKLKDYIKKEYGWELNEHLTYEQYYRGEDESLHVRLELIQAKVVL